MEELSFEDMDQYLLNQNSKIIHQVWFGTIPNKREAAKTYKKLKVYRDSWINKNPKWFYASWNLEKCEKLVKDFYPQHLEMYKKYPYIIQKCDAVRYFILHRYGGLYADMDYFCNKPWDEVIKKYPGDIYVVETPNNTGNDKIHVSNSLMYSAVKNHSYWNSIFIEMELKKNSSYYYTSRHITIMMTTGPSIINRIFNKYKYRYKLNHYPSKLFHPYGVTDDAKTLSNCNKEQDVYAYHIQNGCWHKKDTVILNFIYQEYKIILVIIFLLIIPLLFKK
tara:strand:- start:2046 stop:2879 length:834 start_codon:yes stop_codon:yes gene_type:complete